MQDQNYKCSVHKDTDAIRCCGECKAYYCNKCEKQHSELLKNHPIQLNYHCKDHNTLSVLLVSERSKQEKMENILIVMYAI